MKRNVFLTLAMALILNFGARADEGMWIPMLVERLNYDDMQKMGMKLTAEEIYSINNASIKDAIVIFGRGCTGEIISDQGLLLTNHHCGYGRIQAHSSVEHDYLKDGFWAMNKKEELANPGLTAKFLVRIEAVTEQVMIGITEDMDPEARSKKMKESIKVLVENAVAGTYYDASVRSFFAGNEYYLFVYETFKDVRFVGAPPSSIGKFGADTDNWMWPRHTGDFSLFRVYTGPDGKPAEYSEKNIPMKPKHHLPISLNGVEKGDFTFIMGYPGGTERYLTSWGVDRAVNTYNPTVVKIRQEKLDIMRVEMDAEDAVRIQYASKFARTSNYWKYYIGQTKGLKRLKVYDKKVAIESEFNEWVNANADRRKEYGGTLQGFDEAYMIMNQYTKAYVYYREAIQRGAEILAAASGFTKLKEQLEEDASEADIKKTVDALKAKEVGYFKDYYEPIDQKLLASMMKMFYENVRADLQPEYLKDINSKYKGNFDKYAADLFAKSIFSSQKKVDSFLKNPKEKTIAKDPAFVAYNAFMKEYKRIVREMNTAKDLLSESNRLFIAGLREMNDDKTYYPDANFTMRLTYGTVQDYYPEDAVHFNYFTTLYGVMQKEDPSTWEFMVPEKLKSLYKTKNYGPYGEDGVMKVCFLTNHDITGGNSGSPVINGKGELVGLAFDGNWEAMSGDIAFEPELQRTINVDIRYVLFIIDKFAGATNIVDELTLLKE